MDTDKRCVCGSNSTILDTVRGVDKWVCFQHIKPCACERNHEAHRDWDFRGSTIAEMEYQMPTPDVPGYTAEGIWTK
jgi:hypothetical protein